MNYIKLFESVASDRRAFKNWLTQIKDDNQFDENLFSLFIKHRPKLEDKNILNYKSKDSLIQAIEQVTIYVPLKTYQKDLSLWNKTGANVDLLYQDDNWVILHPKDFKSEQKIASGCRICTNYEGMYNCYLKNSVYLFTVLDLKNNERYFVSYTHKQTGFQKEKTYNIVDKTDNMFIVKNWDDKKWVEDNPPSGKRKGLPENIDFIKICEDILEEKFLK